MRKIKRTPVWLIVKELVFGALALLSTATVLYDWLGNPSEITRRTLDTIDFVIACLFLFDFAVELYLSKTRWRYFKRNWYFLLAAIPFSDAVTDSLRGLRVLRVVRIIRAGEHLDYGLITKK